MKRFYGRVFGAFFLICLTSFGTMAAPQNVVLISVDGLRPDFYLQKKYKAPVMRRLMSEGSYAKAVTAVFPTLTYPNHATMITGVLTAKHGILSNTLMDLQRGPSPAWYWEAEHIKVPTLFDMAKSARMTTAAVRWPVTLKASNITHNIPEIFGKTGFYDGDSFDLTVKYTKPELINDVLNHTTLKRYDNEVEMDFWVAEASAHILRTRKPRFLAIHLANVDHVEHGKGRDAPEVTAAVEEVDRNIGLIADAVDLQNTCLIITGDHGFVDVSKRISPNVLFKAKGWIRTGKTGQLEWDVIAHASGAQAAIYVKDPNLIKSVTEYLKANAHLGFEVVGRQKLNNLGAYPDAALAVVGKPGFTISGSSSGAVVASSGFLKGNHGFLPERAQVKTGLVAAGCGKKSGRSIGEIGLVDIAPTVAKILKLRGGRFDGDAVGL